MIKQSQKGKSEQAKRTYNALVKCIEELAGKNGAPKRCGCKDSEGRLHCWLGALEEQKPKNVLAYAAVLQIYWRCDGISWPEGLFAPGLDILYSAGRGRGGRSSPRIKKLSTLWRNRAKIVEMILEEKSWASIATEIGLVRKNAPNSTVKRAGDDLRRLMRNPPQWPMTLDPDVYKLGMFMLGLPIEPEPLDPNQETFQALLAIGAAYSPRRKR